MSKIEDEILQAYETIEAQAAALAKLEAEVKTFAQEVAHLQTEIESQAVAQQAQLQELETAIVEAEDVDPRRRARTVPPDRPPVRRRRPRRLSRTAPASAASPPSPPDAQRPDQPRSAHLLQELRPAPLPWTKHDGAGVQEAAIQEVDPTRLGRRRCRRGSLAPSACDRPAHGSAADRSAGACLDRLRSGRKKKARARIA